jgi:shikimate kinase
VIHLIGPGGAGKSTVAPQLAALLGWTALDLDRLFESRHGSIDDFIRFHGYAAYASANIETFLATPTQPPAVFALSSGFMTYGAAAHPLWQHIQHTIAAAATTFLLIPSLDVETCVVEIVRRQASRPLPLPRSAQREEAVIRDRLPRYLALPVRRVTTMRPAAAVANEIARLASLSCRREEVRLRVQPRTVAEVLR